MIVQDREDTYIRYFNCVSFIFLCSIYRQIGETEQVNTNGVCIYRYFVLQ